MSTAPDRQSSLWTRVAALFYWLFPILFLWVLYRDGLLCFFLDDDFAWLSLSRQVHSASDLFAVLFAPAAQGTIRPLSERGFFLLFESLFGFDNLPFRIAAFVTMSVNLLLLNWIARRITGSAAAGCIAATVWAANAALTQVMTWSSAFNQPLCMFFLLSALALFIRFSDTGRSRWWIAQLLTFVIGFGALEVNVVYPALAACYVLFVAPREKMRRLLLSLAPLFAISIAYFLVHRAVAPLAASGVYALHFDRRIFATLALYGKWVILPSGWSSFGHSPALGKLILWIGIVSLVVFFWDAIRRRSRPAVFFVAWFLIALAPVLPLPEHHTEYYLTIPAAGLGMLAGWAFSRRPFFVVAPLLIYLGCQIPVAAQTTHWWLTRTIPVRGLVLGVEAARLRNPGKVLLIDGVDGALYADSMGQGAFYALAADDVYLTPGSERNIQQTSNLSDVERAVLDPGATRRALRNGQVVVYSVSGDHLRNITEAYEKSAPNFLADQLPSRADIGNPLYSWLLGPSWLPSESGVRWMPAAAAVRLRSPGNPGAASGNKLVLDGSCPETELKRGPRHLKVFAGGIFLGETQIEDPESNFHRLFAMPAELTGRDSVEIEIRVDPVARRDGTDYGLVFGKIAIVP